MLSKLINDLYDARLAKAEAEERLRERKEALAAAEQAVIDEMIETEVTSIKVAGNTFSLRTSAQYSCPAEFTEELFTLLRRDGLGAIIKEKVDPRTLSAALREMAEEGELPDDYGSIVKVYEKQSISVRKAN